MSSWYNKILTSTCRKRQDMIYQVKCSLLRLKWRFWYHLSSSNLDFVQIQLFLQTTNQNTMKDKIGAGHWAYSGIGTPAAAPGGSWGPSLTLTWLKLVYIFHNCEHPNMLKLHYFMASTFSVIWGEIIMRKKDYLNSTKSIHWWTCLLWST